MAVPKIAERPFNLYETVVNCGVTALFALFVWYYNIIRCLNTLYRDIAKGFSVTRLIVSLVTGIGVMFLLALLQQELIAHLDWGPNMLMIEVRGVLVNVTFYMVHSLHVPELPASKSANVNWSAQKWTTSPPSMNC